MCPLLLSLHYHLTTISSLPTKRRCPNNVLCPCPLSLRCESHLGAYLVTVKANSHCGRTHRHCRKPCRQCETPITHKNQAQPTCPKGQQWTLFCPYQLTLLVIMLHSKGHLDIFFFSLSLKKFIIYTKSTKSHPF